MEFYLLITSYSFKETENTGPEFAEALRVGKKGQMSYNDICPMLVFFEMVLSMSLRLKLTLFTVGFVLGASMAILSVSVWQSRQRERRDIQTLRTSELNRLKTNLQSSVDIICAVEDREGPPEMSANLEGIVARLKKSAFERNANWIWVLDTNGNSGQSVLLSSPADAHVLMLSGLPDLIK